MVNHPNRSRGPYIAYMGGSSWKIGPHAEFPTIRDCRAYAESYGTTADWCIVVPVKGADKVAEFKRDTSKDGTCWYRVEI
jgi:hypothetical protein